MNTLKDLLYRMADDALILGHRNSEWTGIGPILEEDLAFSSMAQDKIGHAFALYNLLHTYAGEADPDTLGFKRKENEFKCCQFVELPIGEYDFSLIRHFLFDHAELLRYEFLTQSSFQPLAQLAKKIKGEVKYHVMHADTWVIQLSNGTEESKARMQSALNDCLPYALAMFEKTETEAEIISEGLFVGEDELKKAWLNSISPILEKAKLSLPETKEEKIKYGGRKAYHSEYLSPLIAEMTEVVNIDPDAEW
jgi:ring-1,2-phenylacetyl-CoA epoxidase subunit PaaC